MTTHVSPEVAVYKIHRDYTDPHKPIHPSFKNDPYMTQRPISMTTA